MVSGGDKKLLKTPRGWSLANYWYDHKVSKLQTRTYEESLMRVMLTHRAGIERAKVQALCMASLQSKEGTVDALDLYTKALFPYEEENKEEDLQKILLEEVSKGPISITVPQTVKKSGMRSKLLSKVKKDATRKPK